MLIAHHTDRIMGNLFGMVTVALLGTVLAAPAAEAQCQRCGRCGGRRAVAQHPTPASSEMAVDAMECDTSNDASACQDGPRCGRLRSLLEAHRATDGSVAACDGADAQYCGMPAPEYPVPIPTPYPAVWTQLTYPPLMPHNSLPHYRGTYSYRHAPGLSRTNVHWYAPPVLSGLAKFHNLIELPR